MLIFVVRLVGGWARGHLNTDNANGWLQGLCCVSNTADETTTADWDDNGLNLWALFDDFATNGCCAGNDFPVVVGWNEYPFWVFLDGIFAGLLGGVEGIADLPHLTTVVLGGLDFGGRGVAWHENDGLAVADAGGEGDTLGVVTGAAAANGCAFWEGLEFVEGAPELEGLAALENLELEEEVAAAHLGEVVVLQEGSLDGAFVDAALTDALPCGLDVVHGHTDLSIFRHEMK